MLTQLQVTKRILQLTGQRIADAALSNIHDVQGLLAVLVAPPKPKQLAEVLRNKGDLAPLPNVKVYNRRVTPIDKEKMVGRWKVIVGELKKRDLPVTGTGKHSKSVEASWADGGARHYKKTRYWENREKWEKGERSRRP